jgi:hypothetical protein
MNLLFEDMDSSSLYEGGRYNSKRKRSFGDFNDDSESESNSKFDPDAYDSNMAKFRTKLIRSEFEKRRSHSNEVTKNNEISEEEKELAKTTDLLDPFSRKIQNLSLKSRENWYKKILQLMQENYQLTNYFDQDEEKDEIKLCVKIENEILTKSKNLVIYQANCMKKITEIKNLNKEKKSYVSEYKKKEQTELDKLKQADEIEYDIEPAKKNDDEKVNEILADYAKTSLTLNRPIGIHANVGFKSALNIFKQEVNEKQEGQTKDLKDETPPIKNLHKKSESNLEQIENNKIKQEAKIEAKEVTFENVKQSKGEKLNVSKSHEKKSKIKQETVFKSEPKSNKLDLQFISKQVIIELTPLYKLRKISCKVNQNIFLSDLNLKVIFY